MKKQFTRDYWFLAGVWVLAVILLPALLMWFANWISRDTEQALAIFVDKEAASRVLYQGINILNVVLRFIGDGAYLLILVRFWVKPALPVYLLNIVRVLLSMGPSLLFTFEASGARYLFNTLLIPVSGIVVFILAKVFLRVTHEREWAVYLIILTIQKIPVMLIQLVSGWDMGTELFLSLALSAGMDIVLLFAVYWLLWLCSRKWREKPDEEQLVPPEKTVVP